ncbi:MAG TPA: ADP-glyceromanno-heptose 6-epimerase [Bacteroidia bacterium]|nr:ADP-glyceromanno-heptose 6-epimerase [Bacteroidia bacterium]HRS58629.1 ADP-glyceromanno-heptose 6-epimerase [Bacteroidia bacterium]HRU67836.1 ADP-glyceromanno-heptose 6-epimerase [Bacteroidia bacterium]
MIVVTGSAGFIGSCLVRKLNDEFYNDLVLVDDFSNPLKNRNIEGKNYSLKVERSKFFNWLDTNHKLVQLIFHLGARTDTTEFNMDILNELNLEYSRKVWEKCYRYGIPLIYASSAATYGDGILGYDDSHETVEKLQPLNPYGISKNEFDKWALKQDQKPYFWIGLKFFNVYGPNEYHKGRMASVVFHAFHQIKKEGKIRLFRSHRPDYEHGEQKRDFIYVKDVTDVLFYLMHHRNPAFNGIYNLGTGQAESFNALAASLFGTLGLDPFIEYIDTPEDIRDKYQYFTQARMEKLRNIGYEAKFRSLREGVEDYVSEFLLKEKYW